MIEEDLRKLEREYEAIIGWVEFAELFERRVVSDLKITKALELQFEEPKTPQAEKIKQSIDQYRRKKTAELEQELFKQKKRLGDAERTLKTKETKKALEDQRIAGSKIEATLRRIADVNRAELLERDARIFPFYFAPIVVGDGNEKRIIPARYHCRPAGKPAMFDRKYPGLFNARRDSLENFWRDLFGKHHAIVQISSFYENVPLHKFEHRELRAGEEEQNVVLHFNPQPARQMEVACLWSRWQSPGESDLVSFAAITDDPTPEVAAAGHDRTVIVLQRGNVDAWLNPAEGGAASLYRLLGDREKPLFEYRLAA